MLKTKLGIALYKFIEWLDGEKRHLCQKIWCYKFFEILKLSILKFFRVDEDDD